ncbi:GNAT family N-acetyltransferase [Streptomyces sp. NPDC048643]|uniref:GNAT family N-acetyltransferase n=1 Tax=Streptomyces sp. NPDC048643 TaxID=3155637 RepID=UPI00343D40EE
MIEDRVRPGRRMIRTVLPAEADVVAGLHARSRATYHPDGLPEDGTDRVAAWRGAIERREGHVLCLVLDGRIVGVAAFRTAEGAPSDTVRLFQLHIEPGRRRAGLGSALHAACVEEWQADGKRTATLDVHGDNGRARAFYARLGWLPDPEHRPAEDGRHLPLRYTVGE